MRNLVYIGCLLSFLAIVVGCGPSPAERDFSLAVDNIKRTHDVSGVEAALRPVYRQLQSGLAQQIHTNQVQEAIRSLPIFAGVSNELYFTIIGDAKKPGLMVCHEGGPIYQGIVFCPFDGGEAVARLIHGGNVLIRPWTNGIYFYNFLI